MTQELDRFEGREIGQFWPFRRIEYQEVCQSWSIENGAEGAKLRALPIVLPYLHIWFPHQIALKMHFKIV